MSVREPVHLEARRGDVAEIALVAGDPGRVERLSKLLREPKLVSSSRGFPVYTGYVGDKRVTIAAHGIGGPSALIVFEELSALGARVIVRLGTCGSLHPEAAIGDVVVASGAGSLCLASGLGLYMKFKPICPPASPHPELAWRLYRSLSEKLKDRKVHLAPVFTSDSFYAETPGLAEELASYGFKVVEMEVAPLLALSWLRGFKAAAVLIVSDSLVGGVSRIEKGELERAEVEVGAEVLRMLVETGV